MLTPASAAGERMLYRSGTHSEALETLLSSSKGHAIVPLRRLQAQLMQAHKTFNAHAIRASNPGLRTCVCKIKLSIQPHFQVRCAANGAGTHVNEYLPGDMPPIHVRCHKHLPTYSALQTPLET